MNVGGMDLSPADGSSGAPTLTQDAYMGTLCAFFSVAVFCAITRTVVRAYLWRRLFADDYFIFLASGSLITAMVFFFLVVPDLYRFADVAAGKAPPPLDILSRGPDIATRSMLSQLFAWTAIYSVKLSFLFYFFRLVRRVKRMMILWWLNFVVLVPTASVAIAGPYIVCPHIGLDVIFRCVVQPAFQNKQRGMLYYSVAADIATDLLLMSIPIILLWQTRIPLKQKISVGVVLCLSIVMIAIAIIRVIFAEKFGASNQIWTSFWVAVQSCVGVIMVCMTAFRTLFVSDTQTDSKGRVTPSTSRGTPRKPPQALRNFMSRSPSRFESLPQIEVGDTTMTGLRTIIDRNGKTSRMSILHSWRQSDVPVTEERIEYRNDAANMF